MVKFCPSCGKSIADKENFCTECGENIEFYKKNDKKQNVDNKKEESIDNTNKKDIFLSVGCSFFMPGLGQIYNGNAIKGVSIGVLMVFLIFFLKPLAFLVWFIGIIDAYYDANQMNLGKIPSKSENNTDMIIYGVLAFLFIWGSLFSTINVDQSSSSHIQSSLSSPVSSAVIIPTPTESLSQRNVRIANEIVATYHKTHTYSLNDFYVCGDMASDVWDMLKAQGINAKINVGSVDKDISSIKEADHVWVIAEVAPNQYLALETTGGFSVQKSDNPRYYYGWSFYNPKQLKNYQQLSKQYNDAVLKHNLALNDYNNYVEQYNNAGLLSRIGMKSAVDDKNLILNQRIEDLNQITQQINALLSSI